jgi:hypothetical protein
VPHLSQGDRTTDYRVLWGHSSLTHNSITLNIRRVVGDMSLKLITDIIAKPGRVLRRISVSDMALLKTMATFQAGSPPDKETRARTARVTEANIENGYRS